MRKAFLIFILTNIILFNNTAFATSNDTPPGIEQMYTEEFGYKTVNEAIKEFEEHFKRKLDLPTRIPSITFTHQFGDFNDLPGVINDTLRITYVNEDIPESHYNIDVRPIENGIEVNSRQTLDTIKLDDGNFAKYIEIGPSQRVMFHALVFERGHWQYVLSMDKSISDKLGSKELIKIANSFVVKQ